MIRIAVFAEEAKYFMHDTRHDLFWCLRAALHFGSQEIYGNEAMPSDVDLDPDDRRILQFLEGQKDKTSWEPKPKTGPKWFPPVYVAEATSAQDAEALEKTLRSLERLNLLRGGRFEVIRIPDTAWSRDSKQDKDESDKWAWGILMPLYFQVVGEKEEKWLVNFFEAQKDRRGKWSAVKGLASPATVEEQWGCADGKLFARHVSVALLHCQNSEVFLLTVFQHAEGYASLWALPSGNVDRARDQSWEEAAWREFEEEVNPSGSAEWSRESAVDIGAGAAVISLQNLVCLRNGETVQNMSRPTLNFVIAKARTDFFDSFAGSVKDVVLPQKFVTEIPHLQDHACCEKDKKKYHSDRSIPFLENDRSRWVKLDLVKGKVVDPRDHPVHNYIKLLAIALQDGSEPRRKLTSDKKGHLLKEERSPLGSASTAMSCGGGTKRTAKEIAPGRWEVESEAQINKLFVEGRISGDKAKGRRLDSGQEQ